jgi:amino acid transporter
MLIAVIANRAYTELAAMFPEKPGGISLYATEGWRSRFALAGPIATFGYWFAWSSSLAVYAGIVGSLVQAQWFPAETWTWGLGPVDVTFARIVAAGVGGTSTKVGIAITVPSAGRSSCRMNVRIRCTGMDDS